MKIVKVTLRVITPLFLGGNSPNDSPAEFRLASLKGVLRFWFRAVNYEAIELEKSIFGSKETGLGCFMMRANPVEDNTQNNFGAPYLLGQGLCQHEKPTRRRYINPNTFIKIEFIFKNSVCMSYIQHVLESLFFLTHFGGLGSRSRRGMGSVVVDEIEGDVDIDLLKPVKDADSLIKKLEDVIFSKIKGISEYPPKYTAFSQGTRMLVLKNFTSENSSWDKCLNCLDEAFKTFRDKESMRFSKDTGLMINFVKKGILDLAPSRMIFGLPHNYFFKDLGSAQTMNVRRASPLLFHIHQTQNNQYVPIISFFPSIYLPEKTQITYKNHKSITKSVTPSKSFQPIHDFLDEIKQHGHELITGLNSNGGGRNE